MTEPSALEQEAYRRYPQETGTHRRAFIAGAKWATSSIANAVSIERADPAQGEPVVPPKNLPDGWEYHAETHSVICSGCFFRFGADHPDSDGKWTCPNCGRGNGSQSAPEIDRVASIWQASPGIRLNVRAEYPELARAIDILLGNHVDE